MNERDPLITATADAIIHRCQRGAIVPPARLWPRVIEEVQALALEPSNETALAKACYAQVFGVFSEE